MTKQTSGRWQRVKGGVYALAVMVFIFSILASIAAGDYLAGNAAILPGPSNAFRPLEAGYPKAAALAGDGAVLETITIERIRSDGTLDVKARYRPRVIYVFRTGPYVRPERTFPVGAGSGPLRRRADVARIVTSDGIFTIGFDLLDDPIRVVAGLLAHRMVVELNDNVPEPVAAPAPACSVADLWRTALERGAPEDAVATVTYDASGYRFEIPETDVRLAFSTDCRVQ